MLIAYIAIYLKRDRPEKHISNTTIQVIESDAVEAKENFERSSIVTKKVINYL